jgi:hypothetical protein
VTPAWTQLADAVTRAGVIWTRGAPLAAVAADTHFEPVRVPIKGPRSTERGAHYDALRGWLDMWRKAPAQLRIEWRTVNDRVLGTLTLPVAAYIDTLEDLARILGQTADLMWFRDAVEQTPAQFRTFMAARPHRVIAIRSDWPAVVAVSKWLLDNPNSGMHPRQVPVEGAHTKIIERYRRDIAEMLPAPDGSAAGRDSFTSRFGLARKPQRVRLRFLDSSLPGIPPFSDVEVPLAEAAKLSIAPKQVLIVENEVPFLEVPPMHGTVAVLGNGNAAASIVDGLPWVKITMIKYWGDVDTWGFVILDRLRAAVGTHTNVTSVLMDRPTLLGHRDAWVVEDSPISTDVQWLTDEEMGLYDDLVRQRLGHNVRLEQERVPVADVVAALSCGPYLPQRRRRPR